MKFKQRKQLIWVDTGDRPSNSAAALSAEPGFRRNRSSKFIQYQDIYINWGSTKDIVFPANKPRTIKNYPVHVRRATNKLTAFQYFSEAGVTVPTYTTNKTEAVGWNRTFFARTKLTGHSGDGIVVVEKGTPLAEVPDAPLYVSYIFKVREFRVHVFDAQVIDTQQKIRDPDREPVTWKIRSHANGFIFAREGIEYNPARDEIAKSAIEALGLDFGAVDIIEDKEGVFYVLEVNTAPGLEGQTVHSYADAFRDA